MKKNKVIEVKVADYVKQHNETHEDKITRHDVYAMIKEGKLNAHKGYKGAWIIELVEEVNDGPSNSKNSKKTKEYSVKEFVEIYNKKHPKCTVTIPEVRKLLADGKVKGKKVNRVWAITQSPSRRIK